jgi:hypothetical protein
MVEYSFDQVRRALEEVVREHGDDFVYSKPLGRFTCAYVHSGPDGEDVPGCIVAKVLHTLSPDLFRRLAEVENREGTFGVHEFETHGYLPGVFDRPTRKYLGWAQSEQDTFNTWGLARREAERRHLHEVYAQAHEENAELGDVKA